MIHAGDFTRCGHLQEVKEFNTWLGTLPHKHKIVIAGNHELSFDQKFRDKMQLNAQNINAPESVEAPFSPRYVKKKYTVFPCIVYALEYFPPLNSFPQFCLIYFIKI